MFNNFHIDELKMWTILNTMDQLMRPFDRLKCHIQVTRGIFMQRNIRVVRGLPVFILFFETLKVSPLQYAYCSVQ